MAKRSNAEPPDASSHGGKFDHTILVLQGGGALGAYQAGLYAGLTEAGVTPDWIAGVSIGAINAALIAGNPPQRRVERLSEFWEGISANTPFMHPPYMTQLRPMLNALSAISSLTFGVPGFFAPRTLSPLMAPDGHVGALSFYDTRPLRDTLLKLVDFDLINRKDVRLSLGSVDVCSGNSVYFDNQHMHLGPEHVMASGALPPGFPPVEINGVFYWDGGLVSNTPLWYVVDEDYRLGALVLQVDVFSGTGSMPQNMRQVQERMKDIEYASKTRFNSTRVKDTEALRAALRRVIDKLPESLRTDEDVKRLTAISTRGTVALLHFINRHNTFSSDFKDYEFSRATVTDLWNGGLEDARHAIASPKWKEALGMTDGIGIYDMTTR